MPQPPAHKPLGIPFIELQSVDSTNNYARSLIKENILPDRQAPELHGTAVFAHEQTAGKGQRGKSWKSEKSVNIILSIVVDPASLKIDRPFQLIACVATGLHEFFTKYAGNPTTIKWPNDLYWQDRKAGGILIETGISSPPGTFVEQSFVNSYYFIPDQPSENYNWNRAIIGIGTNINQVSFAPEIHNPVSLKQITGKDFAVVELAKELCQSLDNKFFQFSVDGFTGIYSYYLEHLYKKNEKVKLKKGSQVFEGIIKGVTDSGQLVVEHAIEEEFEFGTIEWIL